MNFKKTSAHARLYKYIWSGKLPDNLCPYFWKVLAALLLFIPVVIARLPLYIKYVFVYIYFKFSKDVEERNLSYNEVIRFNERAGETSTGLIIYLGLICLVLLLFIEINWIKCILNAYSYNSVAATSGGIINVGVLLSLMGAYLNNKINNLEYAEKSPNLFTEFIKAKVRKYCPKITWK